MVLFSLTMAFSGCSKSPLKSKESLGPLQIIPNHAFSSMKALYSANSIIYKKNYKLMTLERTIRLEKEEYKWCKNIEKNPKFIKMQQKILLKASQYHNSIITALKYYYGRVAFNCYYYEGIPDGYTMNMNGLIFLRSKI